MNKSIMLIYPPGKAYQRGEDRCQGNIADSSASTLRACNDLGYVAAGLKGKGYRIFLKDYQGEKKKVRHLIRDVEKFRPSVVFLSVTSATIFHDLEVVNKIKIMEPDTCVILKGAVFFNADEKLLKKLDLKYVDYLIGGESDFVGAELIERHLALADIRDIPGVLFRQDGIWQKTWFDNWEENLDALPFPDRSLMNNRLYKRPDTGEMQATISVGRGCPSSCIYCLTPLISGKKLRLRSPASILAEMRECFHVYGIRNFFMKADTFTFDKDFVEQLCTQILHSELAGRVSWVANSRTRPIERETLKIMKQAGCWLIAFGFESGSPESLIRMKKGVTVSDSFRAVSFARSAGLKVYGFFMVGFPWETIEHLNMTKELIFSLNSDFIEIHIPVPYELTELKGLCECEGLGDVDELGKDYFTSPSTGTKSLTKEQVLKFRNKVLKSYYFRISYIGKRFSESISSPLTIFRYCAYGFRLFFSTLKCRREF